MLHVCSVYMQMHLNHLHYVFNRQYTNLSNLLWTTTSIMPNVLYEQANDKCSCIQFTYNLHTCLRFFFFQFLWQNLVNVRTQENQFQLICVCMCLCINTCHAKVTIVKNLIWSLTYNSKKKPILDNRHYSFHLHKQLLEYTTKKKINSASHRCFIFISKFFFF